MPRPKRIADLTDRECEVLDSIRLGLTNEQIAERFNITLAGAKYHVSEILTKLGVSSREQAAAWQPPERPTSWWRRALALSLAAKIVGAAIVVSAIAGISVLAFGVLRGGSGDDFSGNPGGGTGQASAQVPALSDIFAPGPDFSNKVLHWGVQFYYYNNVPDLTQPSSSRGTIDVWVKVGPNNTSTATRSVTKADDGSFLSADLILPGKATTVYNKSINGSCRDESSAPGSDKVLQERRPSYLDLAKMSAWNQANLPAATLSSPPPTGLGTQPETVLAPVGLQWLTRDVPTSNGSGTESMKLEIDPGSGLMFVRESEDHLSDGTVVTHGEERFSLFEVFPAGAVPDSTFDASSLPACP